MRAYKPAGTKNWMLSADRDFNKPTEHAQELADYINNKLEFGSQGKVETKHCEWKNCTCTRIITDEYFSISREDVWKILKVGATKAKKILDILCVHNKIKKITDGGRVVYYIKKKGYTVTAKDIEEASTY